MALSTIQGPGGGVTLPTGFVAKIMEWSANVEIRNVETSGFTDNGNTTYEPTAIAMSGSASGTGEYDTAVTPTLSTTPFPTANFGSTPTITGWKGSLTLTAQTGCTYAGTAVFTNVRFARRFDGKLDITFDFKFTGAITETWAST